MIFPYEEFDLSGVKTYPLKSRKSKVTASDFARPANRATTVGEFLESLPNVLAAADLKAVVAAIAKARRSGGGGVWGLGAHVIKTGLGPVMVDLMRRGFVAAVAANGGAVLHRFEVGLGGAASQDGAESPGPG